MVCASNRALVCTCVPLFPHGSIPISTGTLKNILTVSIFTGLIFKMQYSFNSQSMQHPLHMQIMHRLPLVHGCVVGGLFWIVG